MLHQKTIVWRCLCLSLAWALGTAGASPSAGVRKVLSDLPGQLEVEAGLPGIELRPGNSGGMRVVCGPCASEPAAGAPDLPVAAFTVLSGPAEPRITVTILESDSRIVPEGIAPVGSAKTPDRTEFAQDPERYRLAAAPGAHIGPIGYLRGAPVRGILIPLALWSEPERRLTWLKRIRVEMVFPGMLAQPARIQLKGSFRDQVLNPIGGAYLYGSGAPQGLRKSAAEAPIALGDTLIRISIGDRNPEALDEDKVYALSFAEASALAPSLKAVPIRNLRLYAGPADSLTRAVRGPPVSGTLAEVPIEVRDADGNGVFDGRDSLLFYGHGTSLWKRRNGIPGPIRFEFVSDPYAFENRYYLDFSGKGSGAALRWGEGSREAPPEGGAVSVAYHYLRAEKDQQTLGCTPDNPRMEDYAAGFLWFWHWNGSCKSGSKATTLTRSQLASTQTDLLENAARRPGDSLFLGLFAIPNAARRGFEAWTGGSPEPMAYLDGDPALGNWYVTTDPLPENGSFRIDSLRWGGADPRFDGYTVVYQRRLALSPGNTPLWIFPAETGRPVKYGIAAGAGATCLRIGSGVATTKLVIDSAGVFSDSLTADADARYLVFRQPAALPAQALDLEFLPPPQGNAIRDLETGDGLFPEYLIIAPRALADRALALAKYRNDGKRALQVKTAVVLVEDIYRQFSGGRMSPPAIRDFLRWAYSGWKSGQAGAHVLRYVTLFGDGHYDYRNLSAAGLRDRPPNHIPPYEFSAGGRGEGLASDDFYGLLDSADVLGAGSPMEISIGRIPIKTTANADDYFAKVAAFEDPAKAGAWRGRAVFTADDGTQRGADGDFDPVTDGHTTSSEQIVSGVEGLQPGMTSDKVYLLDYPMNSSFHKPEAAQDLLALINQGTLLVNYVGHGSHNQLSDEVLVQTNDALARMQNGDRTPMFNAFSCTVGRFDDLRSEGMSEQFVLAKGKGAIAAVSALRESFPPQNIRLAKAFYARAFPAPGAANPKTVGDALREAKSSPETSGDESNDSRYALLGEPVLQLRKAPLAIAIARAPDSISALDCDTISGRIEGGSGSGSINIKILAGSVSRTWPPQKGSRIDTQYAQERGGIIFERTFAYRDHRFATDYFIPKQIAFGDTNARILAFAWDGSEEREGSAAITGLSIRGQAHGTCAVDSDGKGPRITITGCEPNESGSVDYPDKVRLALPNCLQIQVMDSSGGVLSSQGPDEGTSIEIAGVIDPFHPHPGIDELNRKVFRFPLEAADIPVGVHLLKVSSRDGYGNYSARTLRMELTRDSSVNALAAYNYPNPMKRAGTTFHFSTALPARSVDYDDPASGGDRLEFTIRIYNQSGMLVRLFEKAHSGITSWDGRDHWGNLLANGVYFYRVVARQEFPVGASPADYRTRDSRRNALIISR